MSRGSRNERPVVGMARNVNDEQTGARNSKPPLRKRRMRIRANLGCPVEKRSELRHPEAVITI